VSIPSRRHASTGSPTLPRAVPTAVDAIPSTPPSKRSPIKPQRTSKKAQLLEEQNRRKAYAQQLFDELNRDVFKGGLPKDTKLWWNNRLLTTAGRAKWHRSRDGVQTSEIELADKILDCDERIRNTLSHEMCHLASWIIDGVPSEAHGKLWKAWAAKVQRKRPDIEVSTRHDYEISHPYQWKCEQCAKIYGRFSKSIEPDHCVCGACKVGKLIPLFATKKTTRNATPKSSKMASGKPQDSPLPSKTVDVVVTVLDDDSDRPMPGIIPEFQSPTPTELASEIDILTGVMDTIRIATNDHGA